MSICMCMFGFTEIVLILQFYSHIHDLQQTKCNLCIAPLPDSYITYNGTINCLWPSKLLPLCLVAFTNVIR